MTATVHHRQTIHQGRVFDVTVENVTLPNGYTTDLTLIRHPGAAAIVAMTEEGCVLMLKQYRHAIGDFIWEIPAGTLDSGEDPLVCARRELEEETGQTARCFEWLTAITPVPGYSNEKIDIYLARELSPSRQKLDCDEVLEVHAIALEEVVGMIAGGKIQDAKTIAGIMLTYLKRHPKAQ
jgi:ADP-ribose pyrophosphatase